MNASSVTHRHFWTAIFAVYSVIVYQSSVLEWLHHEQTNHDQKEKKAIAAAFGDIPRMLWLFLVAGSFSFNCRRYFFIYLSRKNASAECQLHSVSVYVSSALHSAQHFINEFVYAGQINATKLSIPRFLIYSFMNACAMRRILCVRQYFSHRGSNHN